MEIKARLNYLRIAPRKVRSVVDLIRGKEIKDAEHQLKFLPQKSSAPILKLLKSAIANAKSNFNIEKENLFIKEIKTNEGVPYKRWMPVSRGRAYPIMKRTSHIILTLGAKEGIKVEKPDKSASRILTGPPQSESLGGKETKTTSKPVTKKSAKTSLPKVKSSNWVKRIFRRKSM